MKSFLYAALALPLATNALFTMGQYQKYKCMTLDKWEKTNEPCAVACTDYALKADGCKENDFFCHCQRTQRIDDIMVPCMLTPSGVNATCSNEQLGNFQNSVTDVCKYFNATSYTAYATCPMLVFQ